jgi:hypothetical protein
VYYDRKERYAGESKFGLFKMIAFALDGITSFSVFPLRIITFFGFFTCLVSVLFGIWAVLSIIGALYSGTISGDAVAVGGMILLFMGALALVRWIIFGGKSGR